MGLLMSEIPHGTSPIPNRSTALSHSRLSVSSSMFRREDSGSFRSSHTAPPARSGSPKSDPLRCAWAWMIGAVRAEPPAPWRRTARKAMKSAWPRTPVAAQQRASATPSSLTEPRPAVPDRNPAPSGRLRAGAQTSREPFCPRPPLRPSPCAWPARTRRPARGP